MSWIPARFIAHILKEAAPQAIDAQAHDASTRSYLREFFEVILRIRAEDNRLSNRSEAIHLAALYAEMSTDEVFENLTSLNLALAIEDCRRNPPETHGTNEHWQQLALTRQYVDVAASISTYAELVIEYGSLDQLRASREVIEATIAVTCNDARRGYLSLTEQEALLRLGAEGRESILEAYRQINCAIERLGLDQRVAFNPLAG